MVERRGGSLNKKVKWRPSYGGAQGGKFIKKLHGGHCLVERRGEKI